MPAGPADAGFPMPPPGRAALPSDPAAAYAALAREGVVAEPKTLPELYHNARLAEARNDRPGALKAYAALAPLAGDYVDPLLRYAALLKAGGGGRDAARKTLDALGRDARSRAAAAVAAAQGEGPDGAARLEALVAENPDYGPAAYLLSEAYLGRPGGPTLTERRLAFDALDRVLDGDTKLSGFFLDRSLAETWTVTAKRRRDGIEAGFAGAASRPRIEYARSEKGWVAHVRLPEPGTRMALLMGERGEPAPVTSSGTGLATEAEALIPAATGRTTLYVTYEDAAGREAGPFPVAFDPAAAQAAAARETLERFPDSWVTFRRDVPDLLSYAQIAASRCAISSAAIGFGDEPPQDRLVLPACDGATVPDARSLLRLPAGTDAVQVRITFLDGTESPARTFRRP